MSHGAARNSVATFRPISAEWGRECAQTLPGGINPFLPIAGSALRLELSRGKSVDPRGHAYEKISLLLDQQIRRNVGEKFCIMGFNCESFIPAESIDYKRLKSALRY